MSPEPFLILDRALASSAELRLQSNIELYDMVLCFATNHLARVVLVEKTRRHESVSRKFRRPYPGFYVDWR